MSVRSIQSISSSVLKNLKVFRTLCTAILQYFIKLKKKEKKKDSAKKRFSKKKKKKPRKLVLAKTNSLKIFAQVSFSVF